MRFIDSNAFVRYLTNDDPAKARSVFDLFQRVKRGHEVVVTREVHIHETVYVLASPSLYHLSHSEIRDRLAPILALPGLKLDNKRLCLDALNVFADYAQLDFADALAVACMHSQGIQEIYSYDRDFDQLPGITRRDP